MDILKDKSYKSYNYTCRYAPFPYYYNTKDDRYVYGLTGRLARDTQFLIHNIQSGDTLEKLAWKYYGRPDLYWVIADFNRILDSFEDIQKYKRIEIPILSEIEFLRL